MACEGDKIKAMFGPDLQQGLGGFGDTIPQALRDLADQIKKEKWSSHIVRLRQPPHLGLISRDEHQGGSRG